MLKCLEINELFSGRIWKQLGQRIIIMLMMMIFQTSEFSIKEFCSVEHGKEIQSRTTTTLQN
jgi:hypothetical protein